MPGEEIVVLPTGRTSRIKAIVTVEGDLPEAIAGDSIILTLEDEIDISRGDMIVRKNNLPQVDNQLECTICWMSEEPFNLIAPISCNIPPVVCAPLSMN